jgi:hypothetical protein
MSSENTVFDPLKATAVPPVKNKKRHKLEMTLA